MSTEKTIKNQAKKALNGNWIVLIFAMMVIAALFTVVILGVSIVFNAFDIDDFTAARSLNAVSQAVVVLSILALSLVMYAVMPIINGIFKMLVGLSYGKKADIQDLFYYFKDTKRYFRTVWLDFILIFVFNSVSNIFNVYNFVSLILGRSLDENAGFDLTTVLLILAFAVSVIIKICAYIIFVNYSLILYSTDENLRFSIYTGTMWKLSLRYFGKTVKLLFSFIGWILLCFLVIPAIYVLPYILTSAVISAKWLFEFDRNRRLL